MAVVLLWAGACAGLWRAGWLLLALPRRRRFTALRACGRALCWLALHGWPG